MLDKRWDHDLAKRTDSCLKPALWEKFKALCLLAEIPQILYQYLDKRGEPYLSGAMKVMLVASNPHIHLFEGFVPEIIQWEPEFVVRRGRIDFMLYHADGSISVVELKDGSNGLQSVLAGIGQIMGYAVQVGMNNPAISRMQKVLVFSACHTMADDQIIIDACEAAGVIPIPFGSEGAFRKATMDHLFRVLEEKKHRKQEQQHVLF
jgi:hypothetical protein